MSSLRSIEISFKKMHYVTGWLQLKLIEKANEVNEAAHLGSDQRGEAKSGVSAAIERLEENLNK